MKKLRCTIGLLLGIACCVEPRAVQANTDFVTEAVVLNQWLKSNRVVVLDARTAQAYRAGHIPGAFNTWWEDLADTSASPKEPNFGNVLPKEKLARIFGSLGIDQKTKVVVYADAKNGWGEDGRIVWMLRMAGVSDSMMLNGGMQAWQAEGFPVTQSVPTASPKPFTIDRFDAGWNATTAWIQQHRARLKIVDSRTRREFDGATDFGEVRGGHLPGAVLIPFKGLFASDGRLKSRPKLERLFKGAGLEKDDVIVAYCTAGIRSAHMILVLRMLGYGSARNYDGSFYTWAALPRLAVE